MPFRMTPKRKRRSYAPLMPVVVILTAVFALPYLRAATAPEMRGMWVNAWAHGLRSKAEVTDVVKAAKAARLNALFVQARRRGDALYTSDLAPRCASVPRGFDPLAEAIRQGHAAGLEVHAWLTVLPAWSRQAGTKPPANHVLARHPDWVMANRSGRMMRLSDGGEGVFLDPGLPEVHDELARVVAEIVRRYPGLDGIHLDYVRYPSSQWGYNPRAVARFKRETGKTPTGNPAVFADWRRAQVTAMVKKISAAARNVRPDIQMSASVIADRSDAYTHRLQDWSGWMRDEILDFVVPMNYATNHATFNARSKAALSRPGSPAYIGIGAWNQSVSATLKQAETVRSMGAPGMLFYDYANTDASLWPALGKSLFRREAKSR